MALAPDVATSALPSKVLRIMACGRPVLALCSADSDLAREVTEAACGLVVDPQDAANAAGEVIALLTDRERLAEMGRRGRAHVEANYARGVVADRYRALIDEVSTG